MLYSSGRKELHSIHRRGLIAAKVDLILRSDLSLHSIVSVQCKTPSPKRLRRRGFAEKASPKRLPRRLLIETFLFYLAGQRDTVKKASAMAKKTSISTRLIWASMKVLTTFFPLP